MPIELVSCVGCLLAMTCASRSQVLRAELAMTRLQNLQMCLAGAVSLQTEILDLLD